jgi:hypothetical protein
MLPSLTVAAGHFWRKEMAFSTHGSAIAFAFGMLGTCLLIVRNYLDVLASYFMLYDCALTKIGDKKIDEVQIWHALAMMRNFLTRGVIY